MNTVTTFTRKARSSETGFTLFEQVVAIGLFGVLVTLALAVTVTAKRTSSDATSRADIQGLTQTISNWSITHPGEDATAAGLLQPAGNTGFHDSINYTTEWYQAGSGYYCLKVWGNGGSINTGSPLYVSNVSGAADFLLACPAEPDPADYHARAKTTDGAGETIYFNN